MGLGKAGKMLGAGKAQGRRRQPGRAGCGEGATCGDDGPPGGAWPTKGLAEGRFACPGGAPLLLALLVAPLILGAVMLLGEEPGAQAAVMSCARGPGC